MVLFYFSIFGKSGPLCSLCVVCLSLSMNIVFFLFLDFKLYYRYSASSVSHTQILVFQSSGGFFFCVCGCVYEAIFVNLILPSFIFLVLQRFEI